MFGADVAFAYGVFATSMVFWRFDSSMIQWKMALHRVAHDVTHPAANRAAHESSHQATHENFSNNRLKI
jgi:hypothetical protein